MKTEYLCGLPVDKLTYEDIVNDLSTYFSKQEKMIITSVNPQITLHAYEHKEVANYIHRATHRIADGIGVVKLSKWTGGQIQQRITGIDVMDICLGYANQFSKRIFLYGARQEVVEKAVENIRKKYHNLYIVGHLHGYTDKHDFDVVAYINATQPDFLFVALGSPKQETFLEKNIDALNGCVYLDVGGTFDVLAGVTQRAPKFFITHNIEWLYRSVKYKRYERLIQIPQYLAKGICWKWKNRVK